MKLSVMVISHNQAHLIRRCLDSILVQKITAPWEIVISDDASTDDTWDVIQEYVKQYPESKKSGENYVPRVRAYQINSSDYNPTVTSDRCAANKANVYIHAEGKYCVNIDADDYLLGDDIYQYQIDQLDAHPECSVALQNIWYQNDGEPIENGHAWHPNSIWKEDEVITIEDYFQRKAFISNPAFMMRRDNELKPMEKYGLLFDDPVITMYHLSRGKIVCSQKASYVYVQYKNSIWNSLGSKDDNAIRCVTPMITELRYFAEYKADLLLAHLPSCIQALKTYVKAENTLQLSEQTKQYVARYNSRFLNILTANRTMGNRIYLWMLLQYLRVMRRINSHSKRMCRIAFAYMGE